MPAAVAGDVIVYLQQLSSAGGVNTLIITATGTYAVGSVAQSTAGGVPTYSTPSVAGDNTLTYTPANAATNFFDVGSLIIFTCTTAGVWRVTTLSVADNTANVAASALTGTMAFTTV